MDIYVAHSTNFNFEQLYELLEDSQLSDEHNFVFPHKNSDELFDSHTFLRRGAI